MKFPNDANGELLREIHEAGVDLTVVHDVYFFQVFDTQKDAEAMVTELKSSGEECQTSIDNNEIHEDWELCCIIKMVPDHKLITETELRLEKMAESHNGQGDGWGLLEE